MENFLKMTNFFFSVIEFIIQKSVILVKYQTEFGNAYIQKAIDVSSSKT